MTVRGLCTLADRHQPTGLISLEYPDHHAVNACSLAMREARKQHTLGKDKFVFGNLNKEAIP